MNPDRELPYGVKSLIAGFGEPAYGWSLKLRNGHKQWSMIWTGVGVSATWEESTNGGPLTGTFRVRLDERIWRGRKAIFSQILNASREWVTVDA